MRDSEAMTPTLVATPLITPRPATLEVITASSARVLPLAERRRLVRRRRHLMSLREGLAAAGFGIAGLGLAAIALLSLIAR